MTPTRKAPTTRDSAAKVAPTPGRYGSNGQAGSTETDTLDSILNIGTAQAAADVKTGIERTRRVVTRSVQAMREDLPKTDEAVDLEKIGEDILNADLKSVQEKASSDERDFAKCLQAVDDFAKGMDVQFQNLVTPSTDELSIVHNAQDRVVRLQTELNEASRPAFYKTLPGLKGRNLRKVTELTRQLEEAKAGIKLAEAEVQQKVRQRLQEASMDDSIKTYVALSQKTEEIMKERVEQLSGQITIMKGRQTYVLGEKEKTAKRIADLTKELEAKQTELGVEQGTLETMQNGSPEYGAQEKIVSDLTVATEKLRSDREASLSYFHSKEAALKNIEIAVIAATKLSGRHQARILRLHSDTEERAHMYPAHLLNMKTMSDQEFDKLIREIGIQTDQNITEANAQAIVAADNDFLKCVEEQPELLRRTEAVNKALRQHLMTTRNRIDSALREMQDGYGIGRGNSLFVPSPDGPGEEPQGETGTEPATTSVAS